MSSQAYIIEIGSEAVGIVVREAGEANFHFHSALSAFRALDGKKFATPQAAHKAALDHHARRSPVLTRDAA
jgi:hypothetical protein